MTNRMMGGVILVFTVLEQNYAAFQLQIYSCFAQNASLLLCSASYKSGIATQILLISFDSSLSFYPRIKIFVLSLSEEHHNVCSQ